LRQAIRIVSPFPQSELVLAWGWIQKFRRQVADDYSPRTFQQFLIQETDRQGKGLTYAVERDGELGGIVWIDLHAPHLAEAHCLFKKEFWGRATVLPALEQIAAGVFDAGVHKIICPVFADNHAIRSTLAALGAVQEAYYREHILREGELIDMAVYSLFANRPASPEEEVG
jgi:RimJ/RimL family protein N-acetyltransferase